MAASFDAALMRRIAEVVGVESRALSQRDYTASFDKATGLHGVSENWLVCKDSAEVRRIPAGFCSVTVCLRGDLKMPSQS